MTSVSIPKSVTSIGFSAFEGSGLKSVVIPASVTDFGDYIFEDCDELQYVTFSNGITKVQVKEGGVGRWFSECKKLKKLIIPKSLENMDSRICERNESLEAIEIDSDNQAYQSIDGIVYDLSLIHIYSHIWMQRPYLSVLSQSSVFIRQWIRLVLLPVS